MQTESCSDVAKQSKHSSEAPNDSRRTEVLTIQSGLSNGGSFRGTAVPAVITRGTPVPRFMSLCMDTFCFGTASTQVRKFAISISSWLVTRRLLASYR